VQQDRARNRTKPEHGGRDGALAVLGILGDNREMQDVAREADQRLRRVWASLDKR